MVLPCFESYLGHLSKKWNWGGNSTRCGYRCLTNPTRIGDAKRPHIDIRSPRSSQLWPPTTFSRRTSFPFCFLPMCLILFCLVSVTACRSFGHPSSWDAFRSRSPCPRESGVVSEAAPMNWHTVPVSDPAEFVAVLKCRASLRATEHFMSQFRMRIIDPNCERSRARKRNASDS